MNQDSIAILGGGCFWCTEPVFSQLKGVKLVVSGYVGGHTINPTYKDICNGETGHAEAIRITYDDSIIDYETLLEIFFVSHDPTTLNRQGNDIGTQYKSSIFCQDETQKLIARKVINELNAANVFNAPIVTQINGTEIFYPAEDYHQYYYDKNPGQPYCAAVATPKVSKIRAKYAALIK